MGASFLHLVCVDSFPPDLLVRMAAKRVSQSAINWAELSKKIPDSQRMAFQALKTKSDVSLRAINSLPEKLPTIDWNAYQSVNTALVNDFKTKYEGLNVPYPKDTVAGSIDAQAKEAKANYETFVKESTARSVSFKDEMGKWSAMMLPSEMNREELMQALPHLVPQHNPNDVRFYPFNAKWSDEENAKLREEANRTYFDDH